MGMFDKDKEYGRQLTDEFPANEPFVLNAARVDTEPVQTKLGAARRSILTVSRLDRPEEAINVTTLASAIASKIDDQAEGDLPAVVVWREVDSSHGGKAVVLQFHREATEAEAPIR